MNCGCGNSIHPERLSLGYKNCTICGEKVAKANKPYGYVCYGHKTAGSIVITNKTMFEQYKNVSSRMAKGCNMSYASRQTTAVEKFV